VTAVSSVADALERIRGPTTTVTTYGPERDEALHAFLGRFDVELRHEQLPISADAGYLTVRSGGEYRGSVPASAFADAVDPTRDTPRSSTGRESGYGDLGTLLAGTRFTSLERPHLLATSREIEDRAFRAGRGTLYAGFQSLSVYRAQSPVYERLVTETDLTVHVYGESDWTPPAVEGVTVHTGTSGGETSADGNTTTAEGLGAFWFVAFDGGDDETMACALVAEEVCDGAYRGGWTYDPDLARAFTAYLDGTDGSGDPGQSSAGSESGAVSESSTADGRRGCDEHNG
jgi:hypothetical protein